MTRPPAKAPNSPPEEVATTGHSWDGIEEYDTPMPRWWLWTFYATILWSVGYTILYPAWPLVTGATPGLLGYSTRAEVAAEIARYRDANAPLEARMVAAPLGSLAADPELGPYAISAGASVFRTWCAQCHGSGAAGARGYPNLLDDDWLWGGTVEEIRTTVAHGIRAPEDAETRYSEMPRFGTDGLLDKPQIAAVVQHVLAISGQAADPVLAAEGAQVFADTCTACHGAAGTGDRAQGAPDLTDAIWLYGGDAGSLTASVTEARFGVMPAWEGRLSEAAIRAVTAYVHSRGGGE